MPISVTCQCGARLEIDEKFLGKEIPCPDCQRPLPTQVPAKPPPLELPNYRRISGLAVLSLTLALVFVWMPLGAIAAMVVGLLALRQIGKYPNRLEGKNYARAGIIVGGVALLLTTAALLSPMFVLYTDQFVRELKYAGKITYTSNKVFENENINDRIEIARLSDRWAKWTHMGTQANNITTDLLFLVDTTDDAYISCCRVSDIHVDAADEKQKKVLEGIYKSQLVNILGELHNGSLEREGTVLENSKKIIGDKTQELVVDIRLGRVDRRMLIQYPANGKDNFVVLIAACRRGDFDRLQDKFREAFTSVKAGQ